MEKGDAKKMTRLLLVAILITSLFYVYFLAITIQAAVGSEKNSKSLKVLNQKYQGTEEAYFNLLKKLDVDYARQLGFVDQPAKIDYVIRQNAVAYGKGF